MAEEEVSKKDEYIDYLCSRLDGAFSFKDWHEHTYGNSLTEQELRAEIGNDRTQAAAKFRMAVHGQFMRLVR